MRRPPAGRRRRLRSRLPGREALRLAVFALFEAEFRAGSAEEVLERLAAERGARPAAAEHARRIVRGVTDNLTEIDARLAELAPEIPVSELGRVERAILRSGLYEVLYSAAAQAGTINDAVSLARVYSGEAARRLVNGVLGSASRSSGGGARR